MYFPNNSSDSEKKTVENLGVKKYFISRFGAHSGYIMPVLRLMEKDISLKNQYFYEDGIEMLEDIANTYFDQERNLHPGKTLNDLTEEIENTQEIYLFQKAIFEKTLPEYQEKKETLFSRMQELSANLEVKLQQDREYQDADFYRAISILSFFEEIRDGQIDAYEVPELEKICTEIVKLSEEYDLAKAEYLQNEIKK